MNIEFFEPLQKVAKIFGMEIQPTELPDEFLLVDRKTGEEMGDGESGNWSLRDIFDLLREIVTHPESVDMIVL